MKLATPITITDLEQKNFNFDTSEALKDFFNTQADFWASQSNYAGNHSRHYIQKHMDFRAIANQISSWEPSMDGWDANTLDANLRPMINNFSRNSWLWSGHSFLKKWQDLSQTSLDLADAFFEAITSNSSSRLANGFEFFQGYLIAYEFKNQGKTNINKRRVSENKALAELREQLTTKQIELLSEVNEFGRDLTNWAAITKIDFSDWYEQQKTFLDESVIAHSKNFYEQLAIWTEKKTILENQYLEELRFKGAATYWKEKADAFKTQGHGWLTLLISSLVLGVILFAITFNTWLSGNTPELSLRSIEGVILFACLVSSYAFFIKSITKLTFSSFHLMRDAEEREQLTHLYLNLREGKEDDPESRKIILQALFSRTDSGLLGGDSGPTMPTLQDSIKIIGQK